LQQLDLFGGNFAKDADREARAGKRMALD